MVYLFSLLTALLTHSCCVCCKACNVMYVCQPVSGCPSFDKVVCFCFNVANQTEREGNEKKGEGKQTRTQTKVLRKFENFEICQNCLQDSQFDTYPTRQ